jgi:hypothetical protein
MYDAGHLDCLEFVMEHGPPINDGVLGLAIRSGHLACVELLVAQGFPHEPYLHDVDWEEQARPEQLPCLRHLFDQGCAMDRGNLIMAARSHALSYVQFLHKHGMPLWTRAREGPPEAYLAHGPCFGIFQIDCCCMDNNILPIPSGVASSPGLFDVLRWGHACGAPVTPDIEDMIRAKRLATQAVLLSFHGAPRVRRGDGTRAQRAAWVSMYAVPPDQVEDILLKAELEIPESVGRGLFAKQCVEAVDPWPDLGDVNFPEEFRTWGYAG